MTICRGPLAVEGARVTTEYRKLHFYRRNEHLVCRDRRPRLSVMSDYRKPHLNNSRKRLSQAFPSGEVCPQKRSVSAQKQADEEITFLTNLCLYRLSAKTVCFLREEQAPPLPSLLFYRSLAKMMLSSIHKCSAGGTRSPFLPTLRLRRGEGLATAFP